MLASSAMSASSQTPLQDPGFDHTLAECATAAAKALTQAGGWTQLRGRAKECYQRLLTLVSFMHMADGHNSAKIWHFVSEYVARVQQQEKEGTARVSELNSEPFALSCVAVSIKGSPGGASSAAPPVAAGRPTEDEKTFDNPYAWAAAAAERESSTEPPSKRYKVESGAPRPVPPQAKHSGPGFTMPFGAVSPPHQVLMNMGADVTGRLGVEPGTPSPARHSVSPGALYAVH